MFGEGLEPVYECEMNNWRHNTAILQENDVKCPNKAIGVQGELKGDYLKVIKDLDNKKVMRKENHRLQNRLAKDHIATRRKLQALIPGSPASWMAQPILKRNESQFLRPDIQSSQIYRESESTSKAQLVEGLTPLDELTPSDHLTSDASIYRGDRQLEHDAPFVLYYVVLNLSKYFIIKVNLLIRRRCTRVICRGGPSTRLIWEGGPPLEKWGMSTLPSMAIMPVTSTRHLKESSKQSVLDRGFYKICVLIWCGGCKHKMKNP